MNAIKSTFLLSIVGLALTGFGASAFGYTDSHSDDRQNEGHDSSSAGYHESNSRRLDYEVNHINRMLAHVRGKLQAYHAGWRLRRQYEHVRSEIDHINSEFRRGERRYDRRRLRDQIEHVRGELHDLERDLHFRTNDYYQWR